MKYLLLLLIHLSHLTQGQIKIKADRSLFSTYADLTLPSGQPVSIAIKPYIDISQDGHVVTVSNYVNVTIADDTGVIVSEDAERITLENWEGLDLEMLRLTDNSKIVLKDKLWLYSFSVSVDGDAGVYFVASYNFK